MTPARIFCGVVFILAVFTSIFARAVSKASKPDQVFAVAVIVAAVALLGAVA